MGASSYDHLEVVRTLLEGKADINAKNKVKNHLMMMIIIIILLTILMMVVMMMMMIVIDVFILIIDNYDDSK
jgi:hypothetical protein